MRICLVCGLVKESENCLECHEDCSEDIDPPFDQELDFEDEE